MTTTVVVFRILFLVLIAHSFLSAKDVGPSGATPIVPGAPRPKTDRRTEPAAGGRNGEPAPGDQGAELVADSNGLTSLAGRQTTAPPAGSEPNLAELCFLSNGGSSLTLTVNEATPVGSVIGQVEVSGPQAVPD